MKAYNSEVAGAANGVHAFFAKAFNPLDINSLDLSPLGASGDGVFIVSSHRSHADYFMAGMLMYRIGIRNLRFAAGDNLTNMPLIGPKFRAFGAFSVSRDSSLQRSYVRNLCEQVVGMLKDGDSILVFPEGGRSYAGNMMEMRSGITAAGILARARDQKQVVKFVPVTISYERPPELRFFSLVKTGKAWRKPGTGLVKRIIGSILYFGGDLLPFGLFLLLPRFGVDFGGAYVDVHDPVSLPDWVDVAANVDLKARDDFSAQRGNMQILSTKIFDTLFSMYRILPAHVVASVIIDRGAVTPESAAAICKEVAETLREQGRNTRNLDDLGGKDIVDQGVLTLKNAGALKVRNGAFVIRKKWVLAYYAATLS